MHDRWAEGFGIEVPEDIAVRLDKLQQFRISLPRDEPGQRSLWHSACTTHRGYNLSCSDYERLLADCEYVCRLCKRSTDRLVIDHDHSVGWWGVRGLICPACNSHLRWVDSGHRPVDEVTAAFLAAPYPGRRPPAVVPLHTLRSLLRDLFWQEHNAAARRAGFKFDPVHIQKAAAIRRTRKYREWSAKWKAQEEPQRLLCLFTEVDARTKAHRGHPEQAAGDEGGR